MNQHPETTVPNRVVTRGVVVDTPSLRVAGARPVPEEIIRDLLMHAWEHTAICPRPLIVVKGDTPRSGQNSQSADSVVITAGPQTREPHGIPVMYVDTTVPMTLDVKVPLQAGRGRLYNLVGEIERISYQYMLVLAPYHRLTYNNFTPEYEQLNVHQGAISLTLFQFRVPMLQQRTHGSETPASDPLLFPNGISE